MTGILTPKKIFEYQWLGNIAVAGIAAGLAAAGSARDRVDAALNDMVKATVTGLTFAPTVPVLFFVKHFSRKKASEFPVFSKGFSLL